MAKDPYKNSPYDDGGMPLGTTTADYDNADEVRMAQVKDTYVPIPTIFDDDYQPKQFTKKETGMDRNHGLPYGKKGFNSAIGEEAGITEEGDIKEVDFSDPENKDEFEQKEPEEKTDDTSFLDDDKKEEDKKE